MLHIDIWADFGCPACYLAKPASTRRIAGTATVGAYADAINQALTTGGPQ